LGVSFLYTPELNSPHREKIFERHGIGTFSMATEYTKTSPKQLKQLSFSPLTNNNLKQVRF